MKKFIVAVSIMFLTLAGSGLAFADEPVEGDVTSSLDRHAVWTEWQEGDDQSLLVKGAADTSQRTEKSQMTGKTKSDVIHEVHKMESDNTSKFDSSKTDNPVSKID